MIDTICIKHFYRFLACENFKKTWRRLSNRQNPTWILNPASQKTLPRLSIVQTPDSVWHLSAEVSLPKMLFGYNSRLPNQDDLSKGLKEVKEFVEKNSGMSFAIENAVVVRVDYVRDFQMSEIEVTKTIKRLANQNLSRMDKLFYNSETLYFKTKSKCRQIRIYSKFREVMSRENPIEEQIRSAKSILRIESSFVKSTAINRLVSNLSLQDKYALSLLNENVSNRVIATILEKLNFENLQNDEKSNLEILLETFPTRRALNLAGFLEMLKLCGETFYKDKSIGISKDSFYRDAKDCRKAKVWI